MSLNEYYQDELAFLREMGREFAEARPEAARFLGEPGADPDVERLLEGFAFLTGRIRHKLDDELPEITQGLMDMFLPHYLRSIPSMSVLQFKPRDGVATKGLVVERGTEVDSVPVDGTRCRFRTTSTVRPAPVDLGALTLHDTAPQRLTFELTARKGRSLTELENTPLRLFLGGETGPSRMLQLHLLRHVAEVRVAVRGAKAGSGAPGGALEDAAGRFRAAGLGESDTMLPAPAHAPVGLRLLQEYFAFPQRFSFVELDLAGLAEAAQAGDLAAAEGAVAEITIVFTRDADELPMLSSQALRIDCVPIVNLFHHDGDPIRVSAQRLEYNVRPGGDPEHHEIYSVRSVRGILKRTAADREYRPFFSFEGGSAGTSGAPAPTYQLRTEESVSYQGTQHRIRFGGTLEDVETVSLELVCSNRQLPTRLGAGDICHTSPNSPLSLSFANVTPPTAAVPPPLEGDDVHWRLLGHLSINLLSTLSVETLRTTLALYDFRARTDRQARRLLNNRMAALRTVTSRRVTRLREGCPVRGVAVEVVVDEDLFGGEGEMAVFALVLDRVLAGFVSLNGFVELTVRGEKRNETLQHPARLGEGALL